MVLAVGSVAWAIGVLFIGACALMRDSGLFGEEPWPTTQALTLWIVAAVIGGGALVTGWWALIAAEQRSVDRARRAEWDNRVRP